MTSAPPSARAEAAPGVPLLVPEDSPRRWWILAACCTAAFAKLSEPQLWMLGLDIPASAFGTAWRDYRFLANLGVVLFIACQLIGGVLGDLFGRRRIFLIGAIGATVANLLSMIAWDLPSMIVARGLVGLLGALAFPLALGTIRLTFGHAERKIALLILSFVTALGTLASLLGIPIEDWFGWRWALVLPIIAGCVAISLIWRHVPESKALGGFRRVDAFLAAAWTLVFLVLTLGLTAAYTSDSWRNPTTIGAVALGVAGVAFMLYWTVRAQEGDLIQFSSSVPRLFLTQLLLITAILSFALSGYILQLYQFFFTAQQLNGLVSGLALAPIVLGNIFTLRWAGKVTIQQPRHLVVAGGLCAMGVALLLTAQGRPTTPYLLFVPPMTLFGLGFLLASAAWTHFFFSALPPDLSGMSAGINRAAGLIGGAVAGIALSAVLQVVGMADFQVRLADFQLTAEQKEQAMVALDEALQLRGVDDPERNAPEELITLGLMATYRESFSVGVSSALALAGGLCLACGALAFFWLRRLAPQTGPPAHGEHTAEPVIPS